MIATQRIKAARCEKATVFHTRGRIRIVLEGGDRRVIVVSMEDGEEAKPECGNDEKKEKNEERKVLEGSWTVIERDLKVLSGV